MEKKLEYKMPLTTLLCNALELCATAVVDHYKALSTFVRAGFSCCLQYYILLRMPFLPKSLDGGA